MKFRFVNISLHTCHDAVSKSFLSGLALLTSTSVLLLGASHNELQRNLQLKKYSSMLSQEHLSDVNDVSIPENIYSAGYVSMLERSVEVNTSSLNTLHNVAAIEEESFEQVSIIVPALSTMYVDTGDWSLLNVRSGPNDTAQIISQLNPRTQVTILEDITEDTSFVKVSFDNGEGYIHSDFISERRPEFPSGDNSSITIEYVSQYEGPVLDKLIGTIDGPSGKETYYNLPMSKVVSNMHDMGYEGDYWIREDGVKMLGDYILVAANLNVHARGSIIETSLGLGIVADSGDFAEINPYQLDIAVTW